MATLAFIEAHSLFGCFPSFLKWKQNENLVAAIVDAEFNHGAGAPLQNRSHAPQLSLGEDVNCIPSVSSLLAKLAANGDHFGRLKLHKMVLKNVRLLSKMYTWSSIGW